MKRRTEITVEADQVVLVRRRQKKTVKARCATCGTQRFMLTVDETATLLGVGAMTVFRRAEAGQLHWLETEAGSLLICYNSLRPNLSVPPEALNRQ